MLGLLLDIPKLYFTFFTQTYSIDQIYLKAIQYSEAYLEQSRTSKMERL